MTSVGTGKRRQRRVSALSPAAAPYVQSLRVNGRAYAKPWTTYCALARGATLSLPARAAGRTAAGARSAAAAPPSFGPGRPMPKGDCAP